MRLVVILLLATPALAQTPDLIVVADRVWTGNPAHPSAEAVAVVGMRIAAVGSRSEILALRGAATRVIDLPGRFVAPIHRQPHALRRRGQPAAQCESSGCKR
jgi:hypothetical protein